MVLAVAVVIAGGFGCASVTVAIVRVASCGVVVLTPRTMAHATGCL